MPFLRSICAGLILTPLLQLSTAAPAAPVEECAVSRGPTPTLPNNAALPTTTLALTYVFVGRGTQNYTCAAPSASPVALGAIATLYDATALAYTSPQVLHTIPPLAVTQPTPRSPSGLALAAPLLEPGGEHFFDSAGTPVFVLPAAEKILYAAKAAGAAAPGGSGAVDWLYLTARPGYTSVGLAAVYRVETAGGKAVCDEAGAQQVDYAAEYWFFD
ncbi:hypothetical protein B2J93_5650 [Marssonina coronariae]|uniref:Malate dehydrogenase n=1 Tax=Diplocarpon coronariae TaxID=2795749 RepID=A0A218ZBL2_9HELO|nr:hypothetical protein B2J93_5650 [Marssonina coronariae]